MDRRTLLAGGGALAVSACAGNADTRVSTVDVKSFALLSIGERAADSNVGPFNWATLTSPASGGTVPPPVNPAAIGMGIGLSARARAAAEAAANRSAIASAIQPIAFRPKDQMTRALTEAMARRRLPFVVVDDLAISERVRSRNDFSGLPVGTDAVLDLQLDECGYFYEREAGGLSPAVSISGVLRSTVGAGRLEKYYYQADYRASSGDRRFITTDASLTVPRLDQFTGRAAALREGLNALFGLIAERLSEDVERTVKKQPRLP